MNPPNRGASANNPPPRRFNPHHAARRSSAASAAPRVKTITFPLPGPNCTDLTTDQQSALIWLQYFPHDTDTIGSSLDTKLRAINAFIRSRRELFDWPAIRDIRHCTLDVRSLIDDAALRKAWPTFGDDLNASPEQTLHCIAMCLHKQIVARAPSDACTSKPTIVDQINACLRRVRVRPTGCGPCVSQRSLRACNYGRLVTISGTIIRAAASELICTWLAFRCSACAAQQIVRQPDGRMQPPTRCAGEKCRSQGGFVPVIESPHTVTDVLQTIRLQESMQFESGRVPRTIELHFAGDLVDAISPGDEVVVSGVLKVQADETAAGDGGGGPKRRDAASLHSMYVDAVAVTGSRNVMRVHSGDYDETDLEAIEAIRREPCVLRLLVHSLCPGIYGHEMVKAGLILGLFGASNMTGRTDSAAPPGTVDATVALRKRRSQTHILIVGDPGVGKSQMLQACANVSPRGIFVSGTSSTNAGLTVSVRCERGGGSTLEAGAVVLADRGCCCIDEFDKMTADHAALLEVMEEQTVSVAKAGVLCSLPARTSVLAAANPAGGHYNHDRTVVENLRMNAALLSRFDLVFVVLDRPDEHMDRLMTAHITAMYADAQTSGGGTRMTQQTGRENSTQTQRDTMERTLLSSLRLGHNERLDALPAQLMQRYIGYARKNIHPTLSPEAAAELKRFYLAQRAESRSADRTPVTTRQLEALVRLTQARARVALCERATAAHALDVLDIVRFSMADVVRRPEGAAMTQTSRCGATDGKPLSRATQAKRLLAALQQRSEAMGKTVFAMAEIREVAESVAGVGAGTIGQVVDALNMQGALLKKGQNMYKLLSE